MLRDPKANTPPSYSQIDPMGAMIIATAIIIAWSRTIFGKWRFSLPMTWMYTDAEPRDFVEQFKLLAGIAAPVEFQQLVIYKVRVS